MLICADSNERACLRPIPAVDALEPFDCQDCASPTLPVLDADEQTGRTAMLAEIEHFLASIPPEAARDHRLGTVLAIGLAESATLALRLGHETWQTYRAAFRQVVQSQVQRFLGTIGYDVLGGVVATFESSASAIRCAATIASAARQAGLTIRAGIHVGELEWLESGPAGVAIEVANRIFELSEPGDILVSSTIRDLVAGSGLRFEPIASRPAAFEEHGWTLLRVVERSRPPRLPEAPQGGHTAQPAAASLSRREREVTALIAAGLPNRRIAEELFIARSTVERHVANILNKLGFQSRTQIAAWAVASGLAMQRA